MDNTFEIVCDLYPSIPRNELVQRSKYQFSLSDLTNLGGTFVQVSDELSKIVQDRKKLDKSGECLYRCKFPDGVSGNLARKKSNGNFIGTIIDESGIVGQAEWTPVSGIAGGEAILGINPVIFAITVALLTINKRFDAIEAAQKDILQFLQADKESELEGAINSLADIMDHYRFNSDNEVWKGSQITIASSIKAKAEHNIIFYRKQISKALEVDSPLHLNLQAHRMKDKLEHDFKYYQLSVYLFSYASFLTIILGGNYGGEYLDHIIEIIREYSYQYRVDYTMSYDRLESYLNTSIDSTVISKLGMAGKKAGELVGKIPAIEKIPLDSALIAAGGILEDLPEKNNRKAMQTFGNNRDAGIQLFLSAMNSINQVSNRPVELLFDSERLYICECVDR